MILQASIQVENCDQIDVSTSTIATTAYGIPEPVTNAKVVNDTESANCVVEWEHEDSNLVSLKYLVKHYVCTKLERNIAIDIREFRGIIQLLLNFIKIYNSGPIALNKFVKQCGR